MTRKTWLKLAFIKTVAVLLLFAGGVFTVATAVSERPSSALIYGIAAALTCVIGCAVLDLSFKLESGIKGE